MNNHAIFLNGIKDKLLINLTFKTQEKGVIKRKCVPFDFGPSKKKDSIDKTEKYHLWDLESPEVPPEHNLPVRPENIVAIELTSESFDPADYVTWTPPYTWFIKRDWGQFS